MAEDESASDWTLDVAGTGPRADELATLPRVRMHGFVQPADLPNLFHNAAAFVLPSRFEPWGVVVQEAAASGLPIVASTAVGASTHLVRDGGNGWLVPRLVRTCLTFPLYAGHRGYAAVRVERWVRSVTGPGS